MTTTSRDKDGDAKRKVAILGAGPAGLAAAFALTRTADLRARFAVTVYQMGWRAGGKSATGRAMDKGWRIEQNGSHYLFGCYGNSFAMTREAYDVLREHGETGFGDYRGQFVPRNLIVARQQMPDGRFESYFRYFPETPAWPDRGRKYPPLSHYFFVALQLFIGFVLGLILNTNGNTSRSAAVLFRLFPLSPFHTGLWPRIARGLALAVGLVIDWPVGLVVGGLVRVARFLWGAVPRRERRILQRAAIWAATITMRVTRAVIRFADISRLCGPWLRRHGPVARFHRIRIILELLTTGCIGVLADRLWEAGRLEAIDGLDFREWLLRHGASDGDEGAVWSPLIKVWYDAVVAYEEGDRSKPRISAGVTLHAVFRAIATYKGAFAYQMTNEIGDCFIAPIVMALKLRGVDFQFFHRVRDVVPAAGPNAGLVEEIVVDEQIPEERRKRHRLFVAMEPTGGKGPVELRKVWPNRPVFDGENGDADAGPVPSDSYESTQVARTRRLRRGADFHDVVFALPHGVVRDFPGLRGRPGWSETCQHIKAIGTQSMRLWFRKTLRQLGWTPPDPILSGFQYPYSTWEDNGQNRGNESFGHYDAGDEPQAIATLFGPLADADPPGTVDQQALDFYESWIAQLWPALKGTPDEKFEVLFAPGRTGGPARFAWQYVRANVGPLEAYVLALPGTLRHRMRPDETGFANMYAAGEWTRNGFEVGCIEGAVISGLAAAQALARPRAVGTVMGYEDLTFDPFGLGGPRLSRRRRRRSEHPGM